MSAYADNDDFAVGDVLVAMICGFLDPCGPSRHLLSNPRVTIDGDTAELSVKLRVQHIGAADKRDLTYEIFGWYHARVTRLPVGWGIHDWRQEVTAELGTREMFTAAP